MHKLSEDQIEKELEDILSLGNRIETELLKRIASKFKYGDTTGGTLEWYLEMLSEMGGLTAGNRKLIAEYAEVIQDEFEHKLTELGYGSLLQAEKDYVKAYSQGILKAKPEHYLVSDRIKNIWGTSLSLAQEKINLTNTIAAETTERAFLDIVNKCYIEVSTGIYDYNTSLRKAMLDFANKGITGATYVKKDGTLIHYPLDAALRRNVMTTSTKLVNEMQEARAEEWGVDLVEVSSHMGARPLCAPYQGRIYSLNGKHPKYPPLSGTSIGEPAGLFGIHCGHIKYPFIEGISTQTYFPYPDAENEKAYRESQHQRELEVRVRKYKQRCIIAESFGDRNLFSDESVKLKNAERELKAFKTETGRQQQSRTQVTRFGRSISQKAVWANKKTLSY